jgi:TrmH family RNA methyltransferase
MGSLFRTNISYNDLTSLLRKNARDKKLPVYGTLLDGKSIYIEKLTDHGFILIGSESSGIDAKNLEFISNPITIPSFPGSKAESLNAAVAAGIVCAEFRRR